MSSTSRRGFLVLAGTGAAAAGVTAVASSAEAKPARVTTPKNAKGGLVAHVHDVHSDAVTLMVGEREVVVHDADLVARLARAAH
ncbi:MAG TPA: twin-arginine translocation signal domain-containing protein [Mycobacterium sp.]|jgi:cell division ATPase FtsA